MYLNSLSSEETIASIITGSGQSAVGIVRLSGKKSLEIASKICHFKGSLTSHQASFYRFHDEKGRSFDEGLVIYMRAPHSFTGEDVVELQGHGATVVMRQLLKMCLHYGARMSTGGEFSFRAWRNGKIDLAQAESIASLIGSKSEKMARISQSQLEGHLSKKIKQHHADLVEMSAILEAFIDFPQEGLEFITVSELCEKIEKILFSIQTLIDSYQEGQRLHEGVSVCLFGRPNVGKSSLLNTLLRKDRAIVHDRAGTTRDLLCEEMMIGSLPIRLMDTAGIRSAYETVEEEGIQRAWSTIKEVDLILFLMDASTLDKSQNILSCDEKILKQLPPEKTLVVWNKMDITSSTPTKIKDYPQVLIAASPKELPSGEKWQGLGIDNLVSWVEEYFLNIQGSGEDDIILSHLRHKEAFIEVVMHLKEVVKGLKEDRSAELIASDMKGALRALSSVYGGDVTEDVLNSIFSNFCIGK